MRFPLRFAKGVLMKTLFNTAIVYLALGAVAALCVHGIAEQPWIAGASLLGSIPWHLGVGGFLVFLAATLFALRADYSGETLFRPFYIVYNVGVVLTAGSLLAKGLSLLTGTATPLAYTVYEAVGVVGGVLMVAGLVLLMMLLKKVVGHVAQKTPQA